VRAISKLLLLSALAACGAPGSDAVFLPKAKTPAANPSATQAAVPAPPRLVSKQYRGWYRRISDTTQFQPCAANAPLDVSGTPAGLALLRQNYRFTAPWPRAKLYSVLQGAIVTDTPAVKGAPGDSAKPVARTRFMITGVDSMRAWHPGDCGRRTP